MKIFTFFIIVLIVFASGFVLSKYWYSDKSLSEVVEEIKGAVSKGKEKETQKTAEEEMLEVEETSPSVVLESKEDVAEALRAAFMQKYNKTATEVTIDVSKLDGNHAAGGVRFGPETVGGGWFLAAKKDGFWKIVADGNGVVLCTLVEPYDFPVDMVPECFDEATQTMVTF
ncbi:MAG: hypothetical protein WC243_00715 [Patescibacteria group bacterium]|jgi:hypothetical protein